MQNKITKHGENSNGQSDICLLHTRGNSKSSTRVNSNKQSDVSLARINSKGHSAKSLLQYLKSKYQVINVSFEKINTGAWSVKGLIKDSTVKKWVRVYTVNVFR